MQQAVEEKAKERTFKSEFLGRHDGLIRATFDYPPVKRDLMEKLPEGHDMWMFCTACGTRTALTLIQAGVLIKFHLKMEFETTKGMYLESNKCSFCDSKREGFVLKKIEDAIL